jgi:uncharacterized protein YndB with AHSA1/START domain
MVTTPLRGGNAPMADQASLDMVLTRVFHASVDDVWRAWIEPDLVRQWWGPQDFTAPVAEMDVREGGTSLVCMRAPAGFGGQDFYNTWTYTAVVPRERLEYASVFTDANRGALDPVDLGLPPSIPSRVPHVVTFSALGPVRTEVTVRESGYASPDIVEVSRSGMDQCLDKMAVLVERGR